LQNENRVLEKKRHCLVACHSLETTKFLTEIRNADSVMQDPVTAVIVGVGTTHDANERQVLTVSSGDGVDDAQTPDGEGDHHGSHTLPSGVPIRGIAGIDLVAATDVVQSWLRQQMIQQDEVKISRH
jgi:hypothetical protein